MKRSDDEEEYDSTDALMDTAEQEGARQLGAGIMPENNFAFNTELITPDAKQLFIEINKDLVVSNLDKSDMGLARNIIEMVGHLNYLGLDEAGAYFMRDVYSITNTARSRDGFDRRLMATQIIRGERDERKRKRRWL